MTPSVRKRLMQRRLRALREGRGWSLREASRQSGLSGPFISQVETGYASISVDKLIELCKAYQVSVGYAIGESDER